MAILKHLLQFKFLPGLVIVLALFLPPSPVNAQVEECAFTLREAQQLYNQGVIQDIPQMLEACIQRGFSREDRLTAYKLIILCSLYNDDQLQAQQQMLSFLKKYPEYELIPTDPEEFKFLFEKFRTSPIFDYGLFVGGNYSHGTLGEPFTPFNLNHNILRLRPDNLGLQVGLLFNIYIKKKLQVSLEPMFSQKLIRLDYEEELVDGVYKPEHFERQSLVDIPLSVTYSFDLGKFRPYLRAGGMIGYLLNAQASSTILFYDAQGRKVLENSGPDEDIIQYRNQLNYSAIAGGGVKLKISKGYFYLDARYNMGINLQNTGNRFDQHELIWKYAYTDPDFRLNNIMLTFGFVRSFYKPRMLNR